MPDLLGRLAAALADRYVVEREIGCGSMATVFLAEDLKHHRKVAVKVLHPDLAASLGTDRFLREIQIASHLEHPHILALIDSGEADGLPYYVMRYVEGESLGDRLARESQLPVDEAIQIAREVADGIGYAHRHGVVHRDIKPANILLSEGHALIADFGVARAVGGDGQALTSTGLAVGTPAYMSPEQASAGEVDSRSDLYSLGCVLYEMLAGLQPLVGPTPQATAAMRLTEMATPLPVIRETVPGGLDQLVSRLLAKSPADRYATAEKLVEALDRPDLWAEVNPERRLWKRVGSAAVALALLALGVFAAQWFTGRGGGLPIVAQRIAVLPFANGTGDPSFDDLGELTAERVTTWLQREEVGEVVPLSEVTAAAPTAGDAEAVPTVARETGAALVITGSFLESGDSLVFAIRIMDSAGRRQAGMFEFTAAHTDMPDPGLGELASRLSGGLLLAFEEDGLWAFTVYPAVEAYRLYREAVDLQVDRHRLREARDRYFAAWELDTTFVLPLYFSTGPSISLGEYQLADSLNRIVGERFRPTMTEAQRLHYDATRAWLERDLEAAYRAQRRVVALRPDIWYQRHLLGTYCFYTNRPREVVEKMLEAAGFLDDEPANLDWHLRHLALARHMLGDHEAELETAQSLDELGWSNPLYNKYAVGRALAALGRADGVGSAQDRMESLADTTYAAGLYMLATALELRYHGYRDESGPPIRRAVRWFEERPSQLAEDPEYQEFYGFALYHAERWGEAERVLGRVHEASPTNVDVIGYLGLLAARRGDRRSASEHSAVLERFGRDDYDSRSKTWAYRGRIAAVLGERVEAVSHLKRAFDEGLGYRPSAQPRKQYRFDFEAMADHAAYQELMRPKG